MNELKNVIWMNETGHSRPRSNNPEILTLVNRFLDITRKEWLDMNEARDIYMDTAYENSWDIIPARTGKAEIIPLASKRRDKNTDEMMTLEYLNEKMYLFYNNGGPIMEL